MWLKLGKAAKEIKVLMWLFATYLTTSIHATQVRVSGRVPEADASVSCATTGSKKSMHMWGPCNCFYSSSVLAVFQHRLGGMLVPHEELCAAKRHLTHTRLGGKWEERKEKNYIWIICGSVGRKYIEENNEHILDYHFHLMPIHDYHKTTWDHKPKSKWRMPTLKIWDTRKQKYHSTKKGMNLTSDLWPLSLLTKSSWARISRWRILLSRLPEDNNDELQASAPTRRRWPSIVLNLLQREASHILKEQFQNNK